MSAGCGAVNAKKDDENDGRMYSQCVLDWLKDLRYQIVAYDDDGSLAIVSSAEEMKIEEGYENIWDCLTGERRKFDIKYGQVCRVSVTFCDTLENLSIAPVFYDNLDPADVSDDVIMWKQQLRFSYSGEQEYFLESQVKNFQKKKFLFLERKLQLRFSYSGEQEFFTRKITFFFF